MAFLTKEQEETLKSKDWNVKPDGCYIILYRDEFSKNTWKEHCDIIGCSPSSYQIKVLIVGYTAK